MFQNNEGTRSSEGARILQTRDPSRTLLFKEDRLRMLQAKCVRFRVLVMGKRNAGKTTILQRMTDSADGVVVVHDPRPGARKIEDLSIVEASADRGMSDIEYEITYPSNPGFVFHDSRGIEAGSVSEVDQVKAFIADRASRKDLKDQLHVIWYCLPVDNHRALSEEEMRFFETGTGGVPVIAIFTKFEWRVTQAYDILRDEGKTILEAKNEANTLADAQFKETLLKRLNSAKYPPRYYVCLQKMNRPKADCAELTWQTSETMNNNEVLEQLFAKVQQNNVDVSIKAALRATIRKSEEMAQLKRSWMGGKSSAEEIHPNQTMEVLILFPKWNTFWLTVFDDTRINTPWGEKLKYDSDRDDWTRLQEFVPSLAQAVPTWADPDSPPPLQCLCIGVATCIMGDCLYWQEEAPWLDLEAVIEKWEKSHMRDHVVQAVKSAYKNNQHSHDALLEKLTSIVLTHQLRL